METKKREFIDPNDLMKYINENHCYSGLPMAAHICTMELLTYAPRVDAVEVVHGQWVYTEDPEFELDDYYICSECGNNTFFKTNYCDSCGARMDLNFKENLCFNIKQL